MEDAKWMRADWVALGIVTVLAGLFLGMVAAMVTGCAPEPKRPVIRNGDLPVTRPTDIVVVEPAEAYR